MNCPRLTPLRRLVPLVALSGLLCAASASATTVVMNDQELSSVNAKGLFVLENSTDSVSGLDFSSIALNAEVTLNANLRNILLGTQNGVSDINIDAFQFGRSDLTDKERLVQITNPYLQIVYDNTQVGHNKVVGMRVGFDSIAGDIGFLGKVISGSMYVNGGALGGELDATGKQWTGSNAPCPDPCGKTYLTLAQIGAIRAGDPATGAPSRDFWISMLKQPVQFKAPANSGLQDPPQAQAGYWLNWRDKLMALSATLPPNRAPGQ